MREVNARELWQRILETRLQTGEPYLLFIDAVNRALPKHQRELGLKVTHIEPVQRDHAADRHGPLTARSARRSAVCRRLNIETWDQWASAGGFIEDVLRFLDNVLTHFIDEAPDGMTARATIPPCASARSASGVMGFHSFLQCAEHSVGKRDGEVLESARCSARSAGTPMRRLLRWRRSAAPAWMRRNAALTRASATSWRSRRRRRSASSAAAPAACVEPIPANIYTHKTLSGAFSVRNPHLARAASPQKGADTQDVWQSIIEQEGSVAASRIS